MFPLDCRDIKDLTSTYIAVASLGRVSSPSVEFIPPDPEEPEEPRMIGDFEGSSNALWTLFKEETKNHDDARINTLKDDMESALIFVRSYPICTYEELGQTDLWPHRPVYFPPPSLDSCLIANKI